MSLQTKTITTSHQNTMPYAVLTVTEESTSTSANTSTLSWSVVLKRPSSYTPTATKTFTWTIGDYSDSWSGKLTGGGTSDMAIKSGTLTVKHGSDGKKTISLANSFTLNTSWAGTSYGTLYGSGTMTLTDIPRYGTVTQSLVAKTETSITMHWVSDSTVDYIWYSKNGGANWTGIDVDDGTSGNYTFYQLSANTSYSVMTRIRRKDSQLTTDSTAISVTTYNFPYARDLPNFTIGKNLTVGLYNPLGRTVSVTFYGADNTTMTATSSMSGDSISGFNTDTWKNYLYGTIPNTKTGTYKIRVTYNTHVEDRTGGTYSCNETDCRPSIGTLTYQDMNAAIYTRTGDRQKIVQTYSQPKFTVTGLAANKSATISSVGLTVNGSINAMTVSGTSATVQLNSGINSAENVVAIAKITDSRGYTNTANVTVQMLEYHDPTAIISIHRKNNYYDETTINVQATYSDLGGVNNLYMGYDGRKVGTSTWTISGVLDNGVDKTVTCDNQYAWEILIGLEDDIRTGAVEYTIILPRGTPIVYFDRVKESMGLLRIPTGEHVADIHMMYQASGSSNTATSLTADTITKIPLVSTNAIAVGEGYAISDGGIQVTYAGVYKVSGSAQIYGNAASGINRKDVFIYCGSAFSTATEVAAATDNVGTTSAAQHGCVGTTPKLVSAAANDIFYLACRTRGGAGSYYAGNSGTFLLVERIQ